MSQSSSPTVRAFKVGDWVKIKRSKKVIWHPDHDLNDEDYKPPSKELCGVIFIVKYVGIDGTVPVYTIDPHPIFASLFSEDEWGDLQFKGVDVLDKYYDFEIKLVSNNEEQ